MLRTPPSGPEARGISVVVCTRDRPELLESCLASLRAQRHANFEIIVVDNAPADDRTRRLCEASGVRYIREPVAGLGRARNTGSRVATHDLVAFTDDDVIAEPEWLDAIAKAFVPGIDVVTGRVLAAALDTPAQRRFEASGGMDKGPTGRCVRREELSPTDLIAVQQFGVGANMAFRRSVLNELGGFDERLGAGTAARGAEDLDAFHRALAAGLALRYTPAAVVRHRHRPSLDALSRQLFDTGCGFGVYLLLRRSGPPPLRGALARYALGRWLPWLGGRLLRSLVGAHALPAAAVWAQCRGSLHAPAAYRAILIKPS